MEQQNKIEPKKKYPPKIDIIFQAIFGEEGSEHITKDFLEKILNRKIEKTIVILIADFNIKGLEELGYHSVWKIMETDKYLTHTLVFLLIFLLIFINLLYKI